MDKSPYNCCQPMRTHVSAASDPNRQSKSVLIVGPAAGEYSLRSPTGRTNGGFAMYYCPWCGANIKQSPHSMLVAKAAAVNPEVCPVCSGPAVRRCRCRKGDRACAKGHKWHLAGGAVVMGSGH